MELFKSLSMLVWDQLLGSFIYFFVGFIVMLVFLFVIRKKVFFIKKTTIGKIIKTIYFIVLPFVLGISFWIYSATSSAKKDVLETTETAVQELEEEVYPLFHEFIGEEINKFSELNIDNIPGNDELVSQFLREEKLDDKGMVTSITHWILVQTLVYLEEKTIESSVEKIGITKKNITALMNHEDGVFLDKQLLDAPFNFAKKQLFSFISGIFTPYFIMGVLLGLSVFVVLVIDFLVTKKLHSKIEN